MIKLRHGCWRGGIRGCSRTCCQFASMFSEEWIRFWHANPLRQSIGVNDESNSESDFNLRRRSVQALIVRERGVYILKSTKSSRLWWIKPHRVTSNCVCRERNEKSRCRNSKHKKIWFTSSDGRARVEIEGRRNIEKLFETHWQSFLWKEMVRLDANFWF